MKKQKSTWECVECVVNLNGREIRLCVAVGIALRTGLFLNINGLELKKGGWNLFV